MENTHKRLEALLQAMPPISLAEMSEIRLMKRTDQKYLTNIDTLAELLRLTRDDYYTQEIDGRRISPYATTYWDDENEAFFHFHHGILKAGHMIYIRVIPKVLKGSRMAVGPLHALVHNPGMIPLQFLHHGEPGIQALPMPCQDTILQPAADGHDL